MTWQRQLDGALRELARTVDEVPGNPATEQRLLDAFDARADSLRNAAPFRRPGWNLYLAAAASLALLAGGWWGVTRWQQGPGEAAQGKVSPRSPEVASASVPVPEPPAAGGSAQASPPRTALRAAGGAAALQAQRARTANHGSASSAADAGSDESDEFIALPAADRMPSFESGMIVRVELPVSSLPAYGFPVIPEGARAPVAADVIVGQDGQPRAIRLVSVQTATRRRQ